MLDSVRWRGLILQVALLVGLLIGGGLSAVGAHAQDAAERAASAAEATAVAAEQSRDWLVVGLLGAASLAGFGLAYRLA